MHVIWLKCAYVCPRAHKITREKSKRNVVETWLYARVRREQVIYVLVWPHRENRKQFWEKLVRKIITFQMVTVFADICVSSSFAIVTAQWRQWYEPDRHCWLNECPVASGGWPLCLPLSLRLLFFLDGQLNFLSLSLFFSDSTNASAVSRPATTIAAVAAAAVILLIIIIASFIHCVHQQLQFKLQFWFISCFRFFRRQNLNSDFTDSALGSSDKSPLPYGNFQLRDTTVQSILNHPRYGPKWVLGISVAVPWPKDANQFYLSVPFAGHR